MRLSHGYSALVCAIAFAACSAPADDTEDTTAKSSTGFTNIDLDDTGNTVVDDDKMMGMFASSDDFEAATGSTLIVTDDKELAEAAEAAAAAMMTAQECVGVSEQAQQTIVPVDIIFVIDNSSSMEGEIAQVQARINTDFAQIIGDSGLDYRVIMISRYGDIGIPVGQSDYPICIGAPLGGTACTTPSTDALINSDKFFHYSADVGSTDPACDILDGFTAPDELLGDDGTATAGWTALFPNGYRDVLRPESFKHFIIITDDSPGCTTAAGRQLGGGGGGGQFAGGGGGGGNFSTTFDTALLTLAPEQFGTATDRRYKWHSIVGMTGKDAAAGAAPEPWVATDGLQTGTCADAVNDGSNYQQLSILTEGLRYSSCLNDNFDAIFQAVAESVIAGAELKCEWAIPEAPPGETLEAGKINLKYTPLSAGAIAGGPIDTGAAGAAATGTGGAGAMADVAAGGAGAVSDPNLDEANVREIGGVPTLADCGDQVAWYPDNPDTPTLLTACPATCQMLRDNGGGKVEVEFGCVTTPPKVQ